MTSDIVFESVRVAVLIALIGYLHIVGRRRVDLSRRGWTLILLGFHLLLFASAIDVTDNFESLNRYTVIGNTPVQAVLEKLVGFLGGFIALTAGLIRWMPTVAGAERLATISAELRESNLKLSQATSELAVLNAKAALQDRAAAPTVGLDEPTGVLTRAAWKRSVANLLPFMDVGDMPCSIMLIELDPPETYERAPSADVHALREVAEGLRCCCRSSDLIARYSDRTFAVLARNMDLDCTKHVAYRIRSHVSGAANADSDAARETDVTVSIGIACADRALDDDWNSVIERANGALDTARVAGRNRVCIAPPAPAAA